MPIRSAQTHRADWDDLRFVLAVAEAGSLAGAARRLGVNHTTVLRRLGAYEAQIGSRLFERLPTGYTPTAVGDDMIRRLSAVEAAIKDIERRAAGTNLALTGTVRLSTTDTLLASVLPPAIAAFRAEFPGVELEISTANAFAVLTHREADVALRPTSAPPQALTGRRIASLGYAAYASHRYLERMGAGALDNQDFLAPDASLRETVAARWFAEGPARRVVMRADTLLGLRDLAAAGLGVALLPCYLGDASPGLSRWPKFDRLDLGSSLWMLTHPDLRRAARIDAVMKRLSAALARNRASLEG